MTLEVQHQPRRFNVEEYARMGEAGIFAPDERVELIEGEILAVGPPNRQTHFLIGQTFRRQPRDSRATPSDSE